MEKLDFDAVIIGGGVTGCSVARELARYRLSVLLVEREEDVCSGTSKANSAIVHAGFDAEPGSLKARFNVEGSAMMPELSRELDFRYRRNGSLVVCFSEDELPHLRELMEKGVKNGVPGLEIISGDEARRREPNLSESVAAAMWAPTGGIVCPFELTIAMAENACTNGVRFMLNTAVRNIAASEGGYTLETDRGTVTCRCVVNAAGVHADTFHNMVSKKRIHITPRKGDYFLLDREVGGYVSSTIFQLPGKMGKGVLVTPTVHGNLLVGPSARDVEDREFTATCQTDMDYVMETARRGVRDIPFRKVITSFAGLRAHEDSDDFIIGEAEDAPGFFDAAGIESPGLSSAPAIGRFLASKVAERLGAPEREDFEPRRRGIVHASELPEEERAALIAREPMYGNIICRCEEISEGEIVDAIRRPVGAVSMDGIKRRVRAGMGRCQAGFCTPKVMGILARELGIDVTQVRKNSAGSELLAGRMEEEK